MLVVVSHQSQVMCLKAGKPSQNKSVGKFVNCEAIHVSTDLVGCTRIQFVFVSKVALPLPAPRASVTELPATICPYKTLATKYRGRKY